MMCQIHTRHRAEYERRLERIQPALDRVKSLLRSSCKSKSLINSQFYVSGECAAWLVGRTERFNVIDIFAVAYLPADFEFPHNNAVYMESNYYTADYTTVINFLTDGTDYQPPIQVIFSWFDFSVVSVFINLFDTGIIFTYECLCDYWKCIVTNNGCLQHGEVHYPLLFNSSSLDDDTLRTFRRLQPIYQKFRKRVYDVSPRNHDDYLLKTSIEINRVNKYSMRLFPIKSMNKYKPQDVAMSFCDYIYCTFCKRRELLAIKYVHLWRHKTYAPPHGYGYKAAQTRFLSWQYNNYNGNNDNDIYTLKHCKCIPPF
ncbi:uncharacterized protein LOC132923771 [Rhopalosiphum padi]|uniref:uncharacterized protein LOC132923771 n=1 Tax=Rhopalosiphum padi TaxID=40932 RepID=UPI00298E925F|nr:uncharacterized protein LOC132923771 [Rhopalosiphum padi]